MNKVKVKLFDILFDNFNFDDLLQFLDQAIAGNKNSYIVTCNVDHLIKLQKDELFRKVYSEADAVIADGMPIVWASRLLRKPLKQKVSGSDIPDRLGASFESRGYRLFFLGAAQGVAEAAGLELRKRYPRLKVVGSYSPTFGFENDDAENERIVHMLLDAKPDIVFVGAGAPKQEKWIYEHYRSYKAPVSIGVGATFDFISGNVRRAPRLFQQTGLEWFWRLCQEPGRLWRRYLVEDMLFLRLLAREMRNAGGRGPNGTY